MPPDQDTAELHSPLKRFVRERGGLMLSTHGAYRDRCVDWAVIDWPGDPACDDDVLDGYDTGAIEAALRKRLTDRTREQYGSIVATILIGIAVNMICRLIVEWWKKRRLNRSMMARWNYASKNPPIPPARRP